MKKNGKNHQQKQNTCTQRNVTTYKTDCDHVHCLFTTENNNNKNNNNNVHVHITSSCSTMAASTLAQSVTTIQYNNSLLSLSRNLVYSGIKTIHTRIFTLGFIHIHIYILTLNNYNNNSTVLERKKHKMIAA